MLENILSAYGLSHDQCEIQTFGTGLINHTWKITHPSGEFILQRINQKIFTNPQLIADNFRIIGDFLKKLSPDYLFVLPITSLSNEDLVREEGGFYRLMPFIRNSSTYDVASSPEIAFEAALQFGRFTKKLSGLDAASLKITLPDFHNLALRYSQFEKSLQTGNKVRIAKADKEVQFVKEQKGLVSIYEKIVSDKNFKKRVTHHDTKISNVLFDENNRGLCVIDLDTTMPGHFISDVGDMMRTYLSPFSEEEEDFLKHEVRQDYFTAIAKGYLQEMKEELSEAELDHFVYSGEYMIYMQAVRFLTDYFNDDVYYGAKYEGHNFIRAKNQMALLHCYQQKSMLF